MVVCNFFDIYMFYFVEDSMLMSVNILINSAFLLFFWGCQKLALITILKSPFGSISFDSWLRCYRII